MNQAETAILLDQFATAYSKLIDEAVLQVWVDNLPPELEADVAAAAAQRIIGVEEFFPTVAKFLGFVAEVQRTRKRQEIEASPFGRDRDCDLCGGTGWQEAPPIEHDDEVTGEVRRDEQFKPCRYCEPMMHSRWEQHNVERKRAVRRKPEDLLERDPAQVFAEARDALAAAEAEDA